MKNGLQRTGARTVTLTQQVINCDRGSAASDRFKVSLGQNISASKTFAGSITLGASITMSGAAAFL